MYLNNLLDHIANNRELHDPIIIVSKDIVFVRHLKSFCYYFNQHKKDETISLVDQLISPTYDQNDIIYDIETIDKGKTVFDNSYYHINDFKVNQKIFALPANCIFIYIYKKNQASNYRILQEYIEKLMNIKISKDCFDYDTPYSIMTKKTSIKYNKGIWMNENEFHQTYYKAQLLYSYDYNMIGRIKVEFNTLKSNKNQYLTFIIPLLYKHLLTKNYSLIDK